MKAVRAVLIVCVALAAETPIITADNDPACVCDLTKSSCDSFCCCDTECDKAKTT